MDQDAEVIVPRSLHTLSISILALIWLNRGLPFYELDLFFHFLQHLETFGRHPRIHRTFSSKRIASTPDL